MLGCNCRNKRDWNRDGGVYTEMNNLQFVRKEGLVDN